MTTRIKVTVALMVGLAAGIGLARYVLAPDTDGNVGQAAGEPEILYWVAPMDSSYRRDGPGKSPMGMDLVPVYADDAAAPGDIVSIDPAIVQNLGVKTAPAERSRLHRLVETVARVGYDEETIHHVHTRVDGWVERLVVKAAGDSVADGQLLFELYSPTLVNAQQEYLAALRGNSPVLLEASRERLEALGVTADEIRQLESSRTVRRRVSFFAPSDGVVVMLGVREGMYVTPATDAMAIANLDSVWVIAEVLERQAGWVASGQAATVRLDYLPGETFAGIVDYVYPELDPVTRTLRVRLRFDNPRRVFRPHMYASVTIAGLPIDNLVHVPRRALIRGGNGDRVVLALGEGRFRPVPVEAGIESGDRIAILRGVEAGDVVVVSAQFLIDSEASTASALSRFESEAAAGSASSDESQDGHRHDSHRHDAHRHHGHRPDGQRHDDRLNNDRSNGSQPNEDRRNEDRDNEDRSSEDRRNEDKEQRR